MTIAWSPEDYLRLDCEADAEEREIVYCEELCAECGCRIPGDDEVITRGRSWHTACATEIFGE